MLCKAMSAVKLFGWSGVDTVKFVARRGAFMQAAAVGTIRSFEGRL
jgi:hypothetical protein